MSILQNLLTIQTPETSNTTETGQELFEYNRTEITQIQNIPITGPGVGGNSSTALSIQGTALSGLAYNTISGSDYYISLPFSVNFNGASYNSVRLAADSYIVFDNAGAYSHVTNPDLASGSPYVNKIFINTNINNAFYESGDLGTYGFTGPRIYSFNTSPNRVTILTYAGYTNGVKSNPLVWSITFYESNSSRIDIHTNTIYTGNDFYNGFYDRTGSLFKSFFLYSNRGYTISSSLNGTFLWTCPENVYEVSAVCIGGGGGAAGGTGANAGNGASGAGGGGLGWKNKISVIPGNTYTVKVGKGGFRYTVGASNVVADSGLESYFINSSTVSGGGGGGGRAQQNIAGGGGGFVGEGGGNGGNGGSRGGNSNIAGGGGGAGGYSGNGGNGGGTNVFGGGSPQSGSSGSGGAGGGGAAGGAADTGGSGGGVGVYGEGTSGNGGVSTLEDGGGGVGGSNGENATSSPFSVSPLYLPSKPGKYGGGGAGSDNSIVEYEDGAHGAVRLIWGPRLTRKFPKRNTQDLYVTYRYIKWEITESRSSSSTQVSEFKLFYNQSEIIYSNSVFVSSSAGSNPQNLIDYSTNTKFTSSTLPLSITFDLINLTNITGYQWFTADNDSTQDPKSWIFYGSSDNLNWTEIDRITNYTAPTSRQAPSKLFYLPIIPR